MTPDRSIALAGTIREALDRDVTIRLATDAEVASLRGADATLEVRRGTAHELFRGPVPSDKIYVQRDGRFVEVGYVVQFEVTMDRIGVTSMGQSSEFFASGLRRCRIVAEGYLQD